MIKKIIKTDGEWKKILTPQQYSILRKKGTEANDVLGTGWIAIIWGSLLVPCIGGWIIVLMSSIMYYVWKKDFPNKAKQINIHGWIAFFIGQFIALMLLGLISACGL